MCVKCGYEVINDGNRDVATGLSNMEIIDGLDESHCRGEEGSREKTFSILTLFKFHFLNPLNALHMICTHKPFQSLWNSTRESNMNLISSFLFMEL